MSLLAGPIDARIRKATEKTNGTEVAEINQLLSQRNISRKKIWEQYSLRGQGYVLRVYDVVLLFRGMRREKGVVGRRSMK